MSEVKVLIIVPAYNEEKCIERTIEVLKKSEYDFLIINDGSKDKTKEILTREKVKFVDLPSNLGIGGAVQTGYLYAYYNDYDYAIQFDADGQHDIEYVEKILQPLKEGRADLTIGSRFIKGSTSEFKSSFLRQVGIRVISRLIYVLSRKKIYDVTSGFRAANKKTIQRFAFDYPTEYPEPISDYELVRCGYRVCEVPVKMRARIGGKSSIRSWKSAYFVLNVFLSIILTPTRRKCDD